MSEYAEILAEICDDGDCTEYAKKYPTEAAAANFASNTRANYKFNFSRPADNFTLEQQLNVDELSMEDENRTPLQFSDRTLSVLEAYVERLPERLRGEIDPVLLDYYLQGERIVAYDPRVLADVELLRRSYEQMFQQYRAKLDDLESRIAVARSTIGTLDAEIMEVAKKNYDLERSIAMALQNLSEQRDVNRRSQELRRIAVLEKELRGVDEKLRKLRKDSADEREKATRFVALRDRTLNDYADYEERIINTFRTALGKRIARGKNVGRAVHRIEMQEIEPSGAAVSSSRAFSQLRRRIYDNIVNNEVHSSAA